MANFSDVAKSAWTTDDGKTTFCVPMASVIHGFIYNKDAFKKIGVEPPKTMAEFYAILDKLKKDGTLRRSCWARPTNGRPRRWASRTSVPNYWDGEMGRLALIAGKEKFTDPEYVAVFKELATWAPYMGNGFEAQTYPDSQNLFSLDKESE